LISGVSKIRKKALERKKKKLKQEVQTTRPYSTPVPVLFAILVPEAVNTINLPAGELRITLTA
jgi:hypothetical protein